jgi:hypothetical protein
MVDTNRPPPNAILSLVVERPETASDSLNVPPTRLSSVGDRVFAVAASRLWDNLPVTVTSASSLTVFRRLLKLASSNCLIPTV